MSKAHLTALVLSLVALCWLAAGHVALTAGGLTVAAPALAVAVAAVAVLAVSAAVVWLAVSAAVVWLAVYRTRAGWVMLAAWQAGKAATS